jgi:uncharacterized protein YvpB
MWKGFQKTVEPGSEGDSRGPVPPETSACGQSQEQPQEQPQGQPQGQSALVLHWQHLKSVSKFFALVGAAFLVTVAFLGMVSLKNATATAEVKSSAGVPGKELVSPRDLVDVAADKVVEQVQAAAAEASEAAAAEAAAAEAAAKESELGWRLVDGSRYYYLDDGSFATGTVEIDGVNVTFDDEGRWVSSRLDVPYLSQLPDMPTGCEVVSVTMMLNHAGVAVTKEEIAARIPYAANPNEGFTGSVYDGGDFLSGGIVWPPALLALVEEYQGSAVDLTGATWEDLCDSIDRGRPVCVWFRSEGLDHTVLLTGYSANTIWMNDPLWDKDVTLSLEDFLSRWAGNENRALSY